MNDTLIKEFIEDKRALGIGKLRLNKYGYIMRNIDALIGKNFDKVDISDMKKLVCKIDENEWADWTKYDHKIIIKNFWRWLKKEENPEETKWIKPKIRNGNHKLPEELLTQEEIKALIDATSNLKYKLLVSLLYESGARIAEILNLKLKHISFDNDRPIAKIVIDGKTGILFDAQSEDSLAKALKKLDSIKINPSDCRQNANRFSKENFIKNFQASVASLLYTK